jgi:hypothetical protein
MPGSIRHPEHTENKGSRVSSRDAEFVRNDGFLGIASQSVLPERHNIHVLTGSLI